MNLPPAYKTFVVALDTTSADNLILDSVISHILNEESHNLDEKDNILKPNDYHKWSFTICDGYFDTLKSSKMQS